MKYLLLFSFLLVGCAQQHRWVGNTEITASGYPVFHRDMVIEPYTLPLIRQCEHVKAPLMYQEYVPPIYKPVFRGVDPQGHMFYDNMLIRPGYWQEVFMGWYCARCGCRL